MDDRIIDKVVILLEVNKDSLDDLRRDLLNLPNAINSKMSSPIINNKSNSSSSFVPFSNQGASGIPFARSNERLNNLIQQQESLSLRFQQKLELSKARLENLNAETNYEAEKTKQMRATTRLQDLRNTSLSLNSDLVKKRTNLVNARTRNLKQSLLNVEGTLQLRAEDRLRRDAEYEQKRLMKKEVYNFKQSRGIKNPYFDYQDMRSIIDRETRNLALSNRFGDFGSSMMSFKRDNSSAEKELEGATYYFKQMKDYSESIATTVGGILTGVKDSVGGFFKSFGRGGYGGYQRGYRPYDEERYEMFHGLSDFVKPAYKVGKLLAKGVGTASVGSTILSGAGFIAGGMATETFKGILRNIKTGQSAMALKNDPMTQQYFANEKGLLDEDKLFATSRILENVQEGAKDKRTLNTLDVKGTYMNTLMGFAAIQNLVNESEGSKDLKFNIQNGKKVGVYVSNNNDNKTLQGSLAFVKDVMGFKNDMEALDYVKKAQPLDVLNFMKKSIAYAGSLGNKSREEIDRFHNNFNALFVNASPNLQTSYYQQGQSNAITGSISTDVHGKVKNDTSQILSALFSKAENNIYEKERVQVGTKQVKIKPNTLEELRTLKSTNQKFTTEPVYEYKPKYDENGNLIISSAIKDQVDAYYNKMALEAVVAGQDVDIAANSNFTKSQQVFDIMTALINQFGNAVVTAQQALAKAADSGLPNINYSLTSPKDTKQIAQGG